MAENNKKYQNKMQDKRLDNIEKSVKVINHEMGDMVARVTGIEANMAWLKWIGLTSAGSLIVGVINMMMK